MSRMCRECRERFPRHRLHRKSLVSDPCAVMHVGVANPRLRAKRSRHSRRMRNPQFSVSGRRSMVKPLQVSTLLVPGLKYFGRNKLTPPFLMPCSPLGIKMLTQIIPLSRSIVEVNYVSLLLPSVYVASARSLYHCSDLTLSQPI